MLDNCKCMQKKLTLLAVLMMSACYSHFSYSSEMCIDASHDAKNNLQIIYESVLKSHTREQYQTVIRKRYDKVENLLSVVSGCIKKEKTSELQKVKPVLVALRAHARSLAFTKFVNWRQVKNQEIVLFEASNTIKPLPVEENGLISHK